MRRAPTVRRLAVGLVLLLILLPIALLVAALAALRMAVDAEPRIRTPVTVSPRDVARVYALLKAHGPSRNPPGVVRAAWLNERDLELLLSEAGRRVAGEVRPQVRLHAQQAWIDLSIALPEGPWTAFGRWANLHLVLQQRPGLPQVQDLSIGRLPLPGALAGWALERALQARHLEAQADLALQAINRVSFLPRVAVVAFAWPDANLRRSLADTLLPPEAQARVQVYAERLAELRAMLGPDRPQITLSSLLPVMGEQVQQRLALGGPGVGSATEEWRAAFLALLLRALPQEAPKLLPASSSWRPMAPFDLRLRGRTDLPLHFLVSAVIAAEGTGPMADAVGVYKEIADSQGGSGFSFIDLAADRAGTRVGVLAQQAPQELSTRMRAPLKDADLLPPVEDLPESMPAAEFRQRFGGIGAPAYQQMLTEIERRLDALALLAPAR